MTYIVSYQKYITKDITKTINLECVELCTINDITYVSTKEELPKTQPKEISQISIVVLTPELKSKIKKESSHVWLIDQRIKDQEILTYGIEDLDLMENLTILNKTLYSFQIKADKIWGDMQLKDLGLL